MTIKEAKEFFRESLFAIYPHTEILALEKIAFEEILGATPTTLVFQGEKKISNELETQLKDVVLSLKKEVPIQYIFGHTEFHNVKIELNKNVLIPRQETEELVDWIIKENRDESNLNLLDIGTGSGCIILCLASNLLNSDCYATDISKDAIAVAKQNARKNGFDVSFSIHDILKNQDNPFPLKYDIVVSNPPYVLESEKTKMHKNVLDYEPELALFVEDSNALIYYNAIANRAKEWLNPGGKLYFEINEQKGDEIFQLLKELGYIDVIVKKDLNSKDRMVRGVLGG